MITILVVLTRLPCINISRIIISNILVLILLLLILSMHNEKEIIPTSPTRPEISILSC